jgi:prophage antirepressor-like protein
MALIVNLYNNMLTYDNKDVVVIVDNDNQLWFHGKQFAKILNYANPKNAISDHVYEHEKITYGDLKKYSDVVLHAHMK